MKLHLFVDHKVKTRKKKMHLLLSFEICGFV